MPQANIPGTLATIIEWAEKPLRPLSSVRRQPIDVGVESSPELIAGWRLLIFPSSDNWASVMPLNLMREECEKSALGRRPLTAAADTARIGSDFVVQ